MWFLTAIINVPAESLAAIHDGHPSATYVSQCVRHSRSHLHDLMAFVRLAS
jgi:hypothetical protein